MTDICLDFFLITYDTLNDDDDEIRDMAAVVVAHILVGQGIKRERKPTIPIKAAHDIASFLVGTFPTSPKLCIGAIQRLCQPSFMEPDWPRAVSDVIAYGLEEDSTLFVQERQNLYIDQVREAALWSKVLKRVSPTAIPKDLGTLFGTWVMDGLNALIKTAKEHQDGPLGWTWKPDMFAVGVQIICAADVLLVWRSRTRKVGVSGSILRRKLRELADVGAETGLHDMWLEKIDRVLNAAVARRLRMIRGVLGTVMQMIG